MGRRCSRWRDAAGRDESLYHAGVGGWAALLAGPCGWTLSRALRAGGEPGAKSVLENSVESLRSDLAVHRIRSVRQTRCLSHRRDHLQGFRALADRRHEPQHALARRPCAQRVRRNRHGVGQARRDQERRPGNREQRARLSRSLRFGHGTLPTVFCRGTDCRRDRPAVALGLRGLVPGDIVNDLTASVGDPNSQIPETKVFLCNIKKKERA